MNWSRSSLVALLVLIALPVHAADSPIPPAIKKALVSPPGEPRLLHALISANYVLQGWDFGSTEYLIGSNLGREGNPILKGIVGDPVKFGALKMGLAVANDYALQKLHQTHPKQAVVVSIISDSFYIWVVHHNLSLIP